MSSSNDTPDHLDTIYPGTISPPRRRSRHTEIISPRTVKAILILMCIVATTVAFIHAGDYLVIDDPNPSDVIVVLGGDDGTRLGKAVELLDSGMAKAIIVDADAQHRWLGRTEADDKQVQIASMGNIAGHIHVCPITETSTIGETKSFYGCVHQFPVLRVLIVTSEYHTRRALSTFRVALPQYQWSVASAENPGEFGSAWWKHREWAATTFQEWEKLFWWQAVDRWLV